MTRICGNLKIKCRNTSPLFRRGRQTLLVGGFVRVLGASTHQSMHIVLNLVAKDSGSRH
jgi:hypothetical protein